MVFVIMKVRVNPEKRREFLQTIASLMEKAPVEKKCREYNMCQDLGDENVFFFFEEWESRSDFTAHMRSLSFTVLLGATRLLCVPPGLSLTLFSELSVQGPAEQSKKPVRVNLDVTTDKGPFAEGDLKRNTTT